jgi:benzoyl-CoA reductase/2-hydroxyglutaryl-CoA dehydratase subunit BcrC/BadD/HgdB
MSANWRYGVKAVPVIEVAIAQNRKAEAGCNLPLLSFKRFVTTVAICGSEISDEAVAASIAVYNENRAVFKSLSKAAALHPDAISPSSRNAVYKAGYFMPRAEHTALVNELCEAVEALPQKKWEGLRIVTTGIISDCPELLKFLRIIR